MHHMSSTMKNQAHTPGGAYQNELLQSFAFLGMRPSSPFSYPPPLMTGGRPNPLPRLPMGEPRLRPLLPDYRPPPH